jgi:hypothetical protein
LSFTKKVVILVANSLFACFIFQPVVVQGQQAASSANFGARTAQPSATTGTHAARGAESSRGSSWGAGKGSFVYSVQPGGVWQNGTTPSAATGIPRAATQSSYSAMDTSSSSGALAAASFIPKSSSTHGSAPPRTVHFSHLSAAHGSGTNTSGRGSVTRPSSSRLNTAGPQSSAGFLGRGAGGSDTRSSSGLNSYRPEHPLITQLPRNSTLHSKTNKR